MLCQTFATLLSETLPYLVLHTAVGIVQRWRQGTLSKGKAFSSDKILEAQGRFKKGILSEICTDHPNVSMTCTNLNCQEDDMQEMYKKDLEMSQKPAARIEQG